jgi:hypothetical protein
MIEIHDSVVKDNDGPWGWTGTQAAWVDAVHALVLGHMPIHPSVAFLFMEFDQVPEIVGQVGKRLIRPSHTSQDEFLIVPLLASHFAGFAANARRSIDEFGNDGWLTHDQNNRAEPWFLHLMR